MMKKIYSILSVFIILGAICCSNMLNAQAYNVSLAQQCNPTTGGTETLSFTGTFPNANGAGTLTVVYFNGDLNSSSEILTINGETGGALGTSNNIGQCTPAADSLVVSIPMATINAWATTGSKIDISVVAASSVNNICSGNSFCVIGRLTYPVATVPNDAGASNITPTLLCPGSDSVKVRINNYGTNQIDSVWVNWRKNGTLQTPIHLKTLLDTATGTGPSSAIVNLGLHAFTAGSTEIFQVWTSSPNGLADTVNTNDTVVANIKPSLSGTYTIGGTSPDYATFNAAVSDLLSIGICGPIVFNVRQGTYTEQITLPSISGSSSANTITFQNDPANTAQPVLAFAGSNSTNNFVVKFDGAEYVTFDSLILSATSSSFYGYVFHFNSRSDHNTIKNSTINGVTNQTTSLATMIYLNGNQTSHLTIDNNKFNNGSYVMYLRAPSTTVTGDSLVITNNTAHDYRYYGCYLYYQNNMRFEGNTLKQQTSATSLGYGVFVGYSNSLKFKGNSIELYGPSTNYGLYINRCYGTATNKVEVVNNMINTSPNATGTAYGIYDVYNKHANIYHNTVNVRGGNPASTRAFIATGSTSTLYGDVDVRNNIFVNAVSGGYASYIFSGATTGYHTNLDNNIYYATGANPIYYGTTAYATFSAYQAAVTVDSNSYFGVPGFLSQTDLHLQGALAADSGANLGVMVDIDGDARPLAPSTGYDIGADEYIPPTCPMGYGLTAFNLTATTADVTWIAGINDTGWIFEYGAPGFTPGTGTPLSSSNDTATITGLTPVTFYDVYVRGICGVGDTSLYFGPFNFRTRCVSTLSGLYTINSGSPTAGTNYTSFADAVAALNNCGISGPTTFHVKQATYTEQVDLGAIVGTSPTNTITFKDDPTNTTPAILTYSASLSANNFVVKFDGAEHIIFDSLTLTAGGPTYAYVLYFPTKANNITVKNCTLNGSSSTTSSLASVVYNQSGTTNLSENITLDNNTINNGSYGIYWWGGSTTTKEGHLKFTNNKVTGFKSYGSYFYYQDSTLIEGNTFVQDPTSTSFCYGILSYYLDDSKVSKNKVELNTTSTNYGIMLGRYNGTSNEVSNNMIVTSNNATGTAYGMYVNYCKNTNVYHNSVNVRAGTATSTRSLYVSGSSSTLYGNVDIRNNIFTNNAGGYASYFTSGATSANYLAKLDYNIYNSSGANPFYFGTTAYATFALYQAGSLKDSNSYFSSPGYYSQKDLHLQGVVAHDNGDTTLGVMDDFDGDARPMSPTTGYDIGADEYIPPTCPSPYSMVFVSATTTSVDVTWTNGPADSSWEVQYGAPGFTIGTGTTVSSATDTATIPGLTSATCYDVWVRSICTVGDTSIWHGPIKVCTKCAPFTDLCEGFETTSAGDVPLCWYKYVNTTSTGDIRVNTSTFASYTGTNYMYMFNSFDAAATMILIAPEVSNLAAGTHRANFWARGDSTIIVGTMSDPTNPGTFTPWDTVDNPNTGGYTNYKVSFASYTGTDKYVAILWDPARTYDYLYVDDYCWEAIPSCEKAPAVTVLNPGVDSTSLNIGWNLDTTQVSYMVAYGPTGYDPITNPAGGDTVTSTTNFKNVGGLQPLTEYCFWVKAICTNGDTSFWDGPHCASTGCPDGIRPPYFQDFTDYKFVSGVGEQKPQCWTEAKGLLGSSSNITTPTSFWTYDGFGNVGFDGAGKVYVGSTNRQEWLVSPTFYLGTDPNIARIIEFDAALTRSGSATAPLNGLGYDDTVAFVVSYDKGITWKISDILIQWDSSGAPSYTGDHITLEMKNTTGYVTFGFYARSSVTNEATEFFVDNFSIRDTTYVGIDEVSFDESFKVYPNPNNGVFTIVNEGNAQQSSIKLLDIQGRVVYDNQYYFTKNGRKQIELSDLTGGVYVLLIQSEGKQEQHRIVIE